MKNNQKKYEEKKSKNRLILIAIAGGLTATTALAGAFAWFTSTSNVAAGKETYGKIEIGAFTSAVDAFNFYPGHANSIDKQDDLEKAVVNGSALATDANKKFTDWIKDVGRANYQILEKSDATVPAATKVAFTKSTITVAGGNVTNISPGTYISSKYTTKNTSTIPLYMRVKKPSVSTGFIAQSFSITIGADPTVLPLVEGSDGYFYLKDAIPPVGAATDINLFFDAYNVGKLNTSTMNSTDITFNPGAIEFIQATNNAAQLSGWNPGASVTLTPYTK